MNTDISVYGHEHVKTPQLERLAQMGVVFERAYCQQPVCGPSRASVMTGLRPNTTTFVKLRDNIRELRPEVITLGQFFQEKGYYVARVGKIYHFDNPQGIGTNGHDDAATWQERFNPSGIDKEFEDQIYRYPADRKRLGMSLSWWDPESLDEEHTDGMVATKTIELIETHKDRPFFIAAGFYRPHCPYVAPKKYFDLYNLEDIEIEALEEARQDLDDVPPIALERDIKGWPYSFQAPIEVARQNKLAYYASNSFVDAQVGRLIDALKENDLLNQTLIVFWSDHGYFLGEKGLWFKNKAFERAMRVPLLLAAPGKAQGARAGATVELLDLYPTLVDLAGFEVPEYLEGRSLRPFMKDPDSDWDKPAFSQVTRGRHLEGYSIRTRQWRYIEWFGRHGAPAGTELYNHDTDPDERTNLAGDSAYVDVIERLQEQLEPYASTRVALWEAR